MKRIMFLLQIMTCMIPAFSFSQSIGIGTLAPDPSAALEIKNAGKGLLIPRVNLQSTADNTTIPAPATSLLVYNTNPGMPSGAGFYFNNGTVSIPNWTSLHGFILPYRDTLSNISSLFSLTNTGWGPAGEFISTNAMGTAALKASTEGSQVTSSAIHGINGASTLSTGFKKGILGESSGTGIGVAGLSQNGFGLYGASSGSTGVYGRSAGGTAGYFSTDSGRALVTNGPIELYNTGASAGKVLMTDAGGDAQWGGAIAFSAKYDGAYVPLTSNDYITVPFNTELFDAANNFLTNSALLNPNTFIAPVKGVYHFDAAITFSGTTPAALTVQFRINTLVQDFLYAFLDDDYLIATTTTGRTFKLNAGDKVTLQVQALFNDDCEILKSSFSGHLLFNQ